MASRPSPPEILFLFFQEPVDSLVDKYEILFRGKVSRNFWSIPKSHPGSRKGTGHQNTQFHRIDHSTAHPDFGLDINRIPLVRLFYADESPHGFSAGFHIPCNTPGYWVVDSSTISLQIQFSISLNPPARKRKKDERDEKRGYKQEVFPAKAIFVPNDRFSLFHLILV